MGDVDHLLQRLRTPSGALPPGVSGRGHALLDFFTLWRPGDRGEVFRWNDPKPGLEEALLWVQGQ